MGSPDAEAGRFSQEGPQHRVTIPRPFALSQCEITVGQFKQFVDETGHITAVEQPDSKGCYVWNTDKANYVQEKGRSWRNPGFDQSPRHPVVCVSWDDAQAYVAWLSQRTGAVYRLPTEAEWEYAARADTETARYWGDKTQCDYANGAGQETKAIADSSWTLAECSDRYVYTAPVASLRPNAFRLYDMIGNVWEWTQDCWHASYKEAPMDGTAWLGTEAECKVRVVRGGSWDYGPRDLRSANRDRGRTDGAGSFQGFRVARAL
jgi:formylglycine-generating enzyme required for sulfatase activity